MRTIRNCNVCVTGGAGFLGSHLVEHLIEDRGCNVMVIDNLCAGRREFIHKDADFEYCDITKSEMHLVKLLKLYGVKYVLSYAAHPYVPDSYARPLHVFEVNATGAIQVINAAQEAGVEAVLQVSSAELYGEGGKVDEIAQFRLARIGEDAVVAPHSTYGVAKAAVDAYVQAAWRERRTPCIALRQFNCLGERETHPYVVPEIVSQLAAQLRLEGTTEFIEPGRYAMKATPVEGQVGIVKLGNNSFRDLLYAGDAVRIAVELLERGQFGEVFNLGSETGIKMYDLASVIGKLMGFSDVRVEQDPARVRPWEIWFLQSSNEKIYEAIGRRPELTSLEEGLRRTIKWFEGAGRVWPWEKGCGQR